MWIKYLSEFPHDADVPADDGVSDEQSLHRPASEVTDREDVTVRPDSLQSHVRTVLRILLKGTNIKEEK